MPPTSSTPVLFDAGQLTSQGAINNALRKLAKVLSESNFQRMIQPLCDKKSVILLILSALDVSVPLHKWLLQHQFSGDELKEAFSTQTFGIVSEFFYLHPALPEISTYQAKYQQAKSARQALRFLLAMNFSSRGVNSPKTIHPPSRKAMAKRTQGGIDHQDFAVLGLAVPCDAKEAQRAITEVRGLLRQLFELFLRDIRKDDIANIIKNEVLGANQQLKVKLANIGTTITTPDDVPAAPATANNFSALTEHLTIRPVLDLEKPDGFGPWRILVGTSSAGASLRQWSKRDGTQSEMIESTLKQLSDGHFSRDNQKKLIGPSTIFPIYEAKVTGDLRLVYHIACELDPDGEYISQVIRVLGLYNHRELDRPGFWQSVAQSLLGTTRMADVARCKERKRINNHNYVPISWPADPEEAVTAPAKDDANNEGWHTALLSNQDRKLLRELVALTKYVSVSQPWLQSLRRNLDVSFPFQTDAVERQIIQTTKSTIVIGRSGTGKTTTMLFKIVGLEHAYQHLGHANTSRPRQLFVTQSRVLASKVKEQYLRYMTSIELLSSQLEEPVIEDDHDDEDDDEEWPISLPRYYSDLDDSHFPLFATFSQLCSMIEMDLIRNYEKRASELLPNSLSWSRVQPDRDLLPISKRNKGKLVTFEWFIDEYWAHFPAGLIWKLDPMLAYGEIVGVISGSSGTLGKEKSYLERDKYQELRGSIHQSTDQIYDIFLKYLQKKLRLGDYDLADRTHAIIRALQKSPSQLNKVDFVYVDETQDNLLIDTLLLRYICRNPNGLFWAGDTAQTISPGSSFRFEELKDLQYKYEAKRHRHLVSGGKARLGGPEKPEMFHLSLNYRSHAGIVDCAHTIVELLVKFWPHGIDRMDRERGQVKGDAPIVYQDLPEDFVTTGRFLSSKSKGERVEMGANQCIIVRDSKAKEQLREQLGDVGIILTVYQSKGLEFNDVFLYNFFHDSAVGDNCWELIWTMVEGKYTHIQFETRKHAALCHELKCLYVAITRARNRLHIADLSDKGRYLQDLWSQKEQIRLCKIHEIGEDFGAGSVVGEWKERAESLRQKKQYEEAALAYQKAAMKHNADVMMAYHQQVVARSAIVSGNKKTNRAVLFATAANSFWCCALSVLCPAGKSHRYLKKAGDCFVEGGNLSRAADAFDLAGKWDDAAQCYKLAKRFEDLSRLLQRPEVVISPDLQNEMQDLVRIYFVKQQNYSKLQEHFTSNEEVDEFLEERNLDSARVEIYIAQQRKHDAAKVHHQEGRFLEALDTCLEDVEDPRCLELAKECILAGLRRLHIVGLSLDAMDSPAIQGFLSRVCDLPQTLLLSQEEIELALYRSLHAGDHQALAQLGDDLYNVGNPWAAFLAYDYHFAQPPKLKEDDIAIVLTILQRFSRYAHLLQRLAFVEDPRDSSTSTWSILGLREAVDTECLLVSPQSILARGGQQAEEPMRKDVIFDNFQSVFREKLLDCVAMEGDNARVAPALYPCIFFAMKGHCNGIFCNNVHIDPGSTWYNDWIQVHLVQIHIYQTIASIQFKSQMRRERRFWIGKLHEALHPPHHIFGSIANLKPSVILDVKRSMNVLIDWIRETAHNLTFEDEAIVFTTVMQVSDLAFTFDKGNAPDYLYKSNFLYSDHCPDYFFRPPGYNNILHELLVCYNPKERSGILIGALTIQHVMHQRILVDVNTLCSFIERVCGSLLLFRQYQGLGSDLHNLILPRSWIASIMLNFDSALALEENCDCIGLLLDPLHHLLGRLSRHAGGWGHLLFESEGSESRETSKDSREHRFAYISRICRCLGLLGANVRHEGLQWRICNILTGPWSRQYARRSSDVPPIRVVPFQSYIEATSFYDVLLATRRSMINRHSEEPLDDMIQLRFSRLSQGDTRQVKGVRPVVYESVDRILGALANLDNSEFAQVTFEGKEEAVEAADGDEEVLDLDAVMDAEVPALDDGYGEEDHQAAAVIQKAYRRHSTIQAESRQSTKKESAYFLSCFKQANRKGMSNPPFRRHFLGILPRMLAALDAFQALLFTEKAKRRHQLTADDDGSYEGLDELNSSLTWIALTIKRLKQVCFKLNPDSDIHNDQDVPKLIENISAGLQLFSNIPPSIFVPDTVKSEVELVYKCVKTPTAVSRSVEASRARARVDDSDSDA